MIHQESPFMMPAILASRETTQNLRFRVFWFDFIHYHHAHHELWTYYVCRI